MPSTTHSRARRTAVALGSTALIAGVGVVMAAFTATTTNPGNSISTGTVAISDNDSNTAMFTVTNARPTTAISRCIRVTYTGSLPSNVRLYASPGITNGTDFTIQVDRVSLGGSPPAVNADCANAAVTNAFASGDLSTFPTSYAAPGVPGKDASAVWNQNDVIDYKITITPKDNTTANARTTAVPTGTFSFTWEAQNT